MQLHEILVRRIAKDVDDDGNGTIDGGERYVYDGSDAHGFCGACALDS